MATTKKITKKGTYKIDITKDMVYTISDLKTAKGVHFNLAEMTLESGYEYVFEKSGNNLLIYTFYDSGKFVTTKITNYYKYYPKNNTILKYNNTFSITPDKINEWKGEYSFSTGYYNNANTSKSYVIGRKGNNYYDIQTDKEYELIADMGGNDTYNVDPWDDDSYLKIIDYAGKDKYYFGYDVTADVLDSKGNDSYDFHCNYKVNVTDKAGSDKYHIFYNYDDVNITDKAGNDKYDIAFNGSYVKIKDNKGNDQYNIDSAYYAVSIEDKAGNDKYNITYGYECEESVITDYKGNDTYNIKYSYYENEINDYAGADKYNISNIYEYFDIVDGKYGSKSSGNDKYNINFVYDDADIYDYYGKDSYNIKYAYDIEVEDYGCNDTYNINNSYANIYDYGKAEKVGKKMNYTLANDKYNVVHSRAYIEDGAGNDTYKFTYSYHNGYTSTVEDKKGKDNYTAKYTSLNITDNGSSSDKYTFTNSQGIINDKGGADTYTAKNTTITINDYSSSSDKYNITGSKSTVINDKGGKDTYNVKDGANVTLVDETSSGDTYNITNTKNVGVNDIGGKDTYKITSSDAKIYDQSASKGDSYTVSNVANKVTITDGGGSSDILTISSAKKSNLIFLADYDSHSEAGEGLVHSGSLIVFDKTKGGFIRLENFFNKGEGNHLAYGTDGKATKGTGYIESVKAGKTGLNSSILSCITSAHINAWAADISAWLNNEDHSFGSVSSLLENGSQAQIKDFIAYCVDNGIK